MATYMHLSDRIGRRIKLHDLHVLMTVVQVGSMGKAAQRLHTCDFEIDRRTGSYIWRKAIGSQSPWH